MISRWPTGLLNASPTWIKSLMITERLTFTTSMLHPVSSTPLLPQLRFHFHGFFTKCPHFLNKLYLISCSERLRKWWVCSWMVMGLGEWESLEATTLVFLSTQQSISTGLMWSLPSMPPPIQNGRFAGKKWASFLILSSNSLWVFFFFFLF